MKLELFDKIDATIDLLNHNREEYHVICKELKYTLLSFLEKDLTMDITTRIKEGNSLRAKIIRNRYYLKYDSPEEILNNLSDLIGLKIDCRFIEDEFHIYKSLKELFIIQLDDGFYTCKSFGHIALELTSHQPQSQKNGFAIYRIDGYYKNGDHKVNFELQIKSLVNSFWGDIEHRLVYKNTNYIATGGVMKDLLASIKANLTIVDRQLHIIFDQMGSENQVSSSFLDRISFEDLIAKAINDLCAKKIEESIGFSLDIRETSNILGHYIFKKNIKSTNDNNQIFQLLHLFSHLQDTQIDFERPIEMGACILGSDPFNEVMGNYLLAKMNKDYEWFVFFRILFAIEPGNNAEDFQLFLSVLKGYLVDSKSYEKRFQCGSSIEAQKIQDDCMEIFAKVLCAIDDIQIVHNSKISLVRKKFTSFLDELEQRVINYKDFKHYQDGYQDELYSILKDIFH